MASIMFLDLDNSTVVSVANLDSPSITGKPTTPNPNENNSKQLVNYRYLRNRVQQAINNIESDYVESDGNKLVGLVPGADYIVNLYGINTINYDPDFPYENMWAKKYPNDYIFVTISNKEKKVFLEDPDNPIPKGYVKIGYLVVKNKAGNVLGQASVVDLIDWPNYDSSFPNSATIRITAPADGCIYGYLNYGIRFGFPIPVRYMNAIRVNDTQIATYKVSMVQQTNQTILVKVNGVEYSEPFTAVPGTRFTARSVGAPGYKGGTVTPASGTINSNTIITVTAATITTYTISVEQTAHQTITLNYNGVDYTTNITNVPLNAVITARISNVEYGYTAGILNYTNYVVKEDKTITASPANPNPYTVRIIQLENQTITVKYDNYYYNTSTSFTAYFDTEMEITIKAKSGYNPGVLQLSGSYIIDPDKANTYKVAGDIQVTASPATEEIGG